MDGYTCFQLRLRIMAASRILRSFCKAVVPVRRSEGGVKDGTARCNMSINSRGQRKGTSFTTMVGRYEEKLRTCPQLHYLYGVSLLLHGDKHVDMENGEWCHPVAHLRERKYMQQVVFVLKTFTFPEVLLQHVFFTFIVMMTLGYVFIESLLISYTWVGNTVCDAVLRRYNVYSKLQPIFIQCVFKLDVHLFKIFFLH